MFNNLKNKKGERKMKNEKINFVSATGGYIELSWGSPFEDTRDSFTSNDVNALANQIKERGLDETASFSSSMDFAKEYGFKNNKDAKELFFKAVELSKTKKTIN
jgi:hypothetical protein